MSAVRRIASNSINSFLGFAGKSLLTPLRADALIRKIIHISVLRDRGDMNFQWDWKLAAALALDTPLVKFLIGLAVFNVAFSGLRFVLEIRQRGKKPNGLPWYAMLFFFGLVVLTGMVSILAYVKAHALDVFGNTADLEQRLAGLVTQHWPTVGHMLPIPILSSLSVADLNARIHDVFAFLAHFWSYIAYRWLMVYLIGVSAFSVITLSTLYFKNWPSLVNFFNGWLLFFLSTTLFWCSTMVVGHVLLRGACEPYIEGGNDYVIHQGMSLRAVLSLLRLFIPFAARSATLTNAQGLAGEQQEASPPLHTTLVQAVFAAAQATPTHTIVIPGVLLVNAAQERIYVANYGYVSQETAGNLLQLIQSLQSAVDTSTAEAKNDATSPNSNILSSLMRGFNLMPVVEVIGGVAGMVDGLCMNGPESLAELAVVWLGNFVLLVVVTTVVVLRWKRAPSPAAKKPDAETPPSVSPPSAPAPNQPASASSSASTAPAPSEPPKVQQPDQQPGSMYPYQPYPFPPHPMMFYPPGYPVMMPPQQPSVTDAKPVKATTDESSKSALPEASLPVIKEPAPLQQPAVPPNLLQEQPPVLQEPMIKLPTVRPASPAETTGESRVAFPIVKTDRTNIQSKKPPRPPGDGDQASLFSQQQSEAIVTVKEPTKNEQELPAAPIGPSANYIAGLADVITEVLVPLEQGSVAVAETDLPQPALPTNDETLAEQLLQPSAPAAEETLAGKLESPTEAVAESTASPTAVMQDQPEELGDQHVISAEEQPQPVESVMKELEGNVVSEGQHQPEKEPPLEQDQQEYGADEDGADEDIAKEDAENTVNEGEKEELIITEAEEAVETPIPAYDRPLEEQNNVAELNEGNIVAAEEASSEVPQKESEKSHEEQTSIEEPSLAEKRQAEETSEANQNAKVEEDEDAALSLTKTSSAFDETTSL